MTRSILASLLHDRSRRAPRAEGVCASPSGRVAATVLILFVGLGALAAGSLAAPPAQRTPGEQAAGSVDPAPSPTAPVTSVAAPTPGASSAAAAAPAVKVEATGAAGAAPAAPGKVQFKGRVQDGGQKPIAGAVVTVVSLKKSEEVEFPGMQGPGGPGPGGPAGPGGDRRRRAFRSLLGGSAQSRLVAGSFFDGKTDAGGAFTVEAEGEGPFNLRVDAPGFAPAIQEKVHPGDLDAPVLLEHGVSANGIVADLASGAPVPDAEVIAIPDLDRGFRDADDPRRFASTTRTGRPGTFAFQELAPGFYTFRVLAVARAAYETEGRSIARESAAKPLTFYLEPGYDVSGRVLDPGGKPAAKLDVFTRLNRRSMTSLRALRGGYAPLVGRTDKDGRFVLRGVPSAGSFYLEITAKDYAPVSQEIPSPRAGATVSGLEIRLEKGVSLRGKIATADEKPVSSGIEATLTYRDVKTRRYLRTINRTDKELRSGPAGEFTIDRLPSGLASITLSVEGFKDLEKKDVAIGRDARGTDLGTLTLDRGKKIAGRVVDEEGKPVPSAKISGSMFRFGAAPGFAEGRSDASGKFVLSGLAEEGSWTIDAAAPGFTTGTQSDVTPEGDPIEITLKRAGSIKGRIVFGDPPKPVRNFTVEANSSESGRGGPLRGMFGGGQRQRQSNPGGDFTIDSLAPGSYSLVCKADGLQELVKSGIEVRGGEATELDDIPLEAGGTIRGRVQSKEELPVAGAVVRVKSSALFDFRALMGRQGGVLTDLAGRFELRGLPAGATTIIVEPESYAKVEVPNITVASGAETDEVVVHVGKGGRLEGRVLDPDGRARSGFMVTAMAGVADFSTRLSGLTDDQGHYAIENVSAGSYRVTSLPFASAEDEEGGGGARGGGGMLGGMDSQSADVKDGETTVVNFGEKKIKMSGAVRRKSGETGGLMVIFMPSGSRGRAGVKMATTDETGRYEISLNEPGDYDVALADQGMRGGTALKVTVPDRPEFSYDITLPEGGLAGRVTGDDGQPLKGVNVMAAPTPGKDERPSAIGNRGSRTTSGDDGTYRLDGLAPGKYDLTFSREGLGTEIQRGVEVKGTDEVPGVDQILSAGIPFKVMVTSPSSSGVKGALIMVTQGGTPLGGVGGMTRDDGSLEMKQMKVGTYSFIALTGDYAPGVLREVSVGGEDDADSAVVPLTSGGAARIKVQDGDKKPISGASLTIESSGEADMAAALEVLTAMRRIPSASGADGAIAVEHLPPGAYDVTVTKGDKKLTKSLSIEEGTTATLTMTLE